MSHATIALVLIMAYVEPQPSTFQTRKLVRRIATSSQNATSARSYASQEAICRAFYREDFRKAMAGVAANGDLLVYARPSVECKAK